MRDVDDDAETVHLADDSPAKVGEPGSRRIPFAGAQTIVERPREQDVAQAEGVKGVQVFQLVFNQLTALRPQENPDLSMMFRAQHVL